MIRILDIANPLLIWWFNNVFQITKLFPSFCVSYSASYTLYHERNITCFSFRHYIHIQDKKGAFISVLLFDSKFSQKQLQSNSSNVHLLEHGHGVITGCNGKRANSLSKEHKIIMTAQVSFALPCAKRHQCYYEQNWTLLTRNKGQWVSKQKDQSNWTNSFILVL